MKKFFAILVSALMVYTMMTPVMAEGTDTIVSNEEQFVNAINDPTVSSIVLNEDFTLNTMVTIDKDLVINFNGKTITYDAAEKGDDIPAGIIDITGDSNVIFTGNGKITYNKDSDGGYMNSDSTGYCIRLNKDAVLTIKDGTYDSGLTCVQVDNNAKCIIIGGFFRADIQYDGRYWLLNKIDNSSSVFEIYGGTFENFDPSASETENPEQNFLGEGATVIKEGSNYIVSHEHNQEIVLAGKNATCTETGLTEGKLCSICGIITIEQEIIPALGHTFVDGICTVCGAKDPDYVEPVKEPEVILPEVDPSQPSKEISVGITSETAKEDLANDVANIVNDIENGNTIDQDEMSSETLTALKEEIANESVINTEVIVTTLKEEDVPESDMEAITKALGNKKVASYLDINILLTAVRKDGETIELGNLNRLDKPMTFTIVIPEDLKAEGRTYSMIRVHNGETTTLATTQNKDGSLSFTTDRFSTYALTYTDAKPEVEVPDTAVTYNYLIGTGILTACALTGVVILRKRYSK